MLSVTLLVFNLKTSMLKINRGFFKKKAGIVSSLCETVADLIII